MAQTFLLSDEMVGTEGCGGVVGVEVVELFLHIAQPRWFGTGPGGRRAGGGALHFSRGILSRELRAVVLIPPSPRLYNYLAIF